MSQRVTEQFYTSAEFEKMPEFHERYELLDGKPVEKPMPKLKHSEVSWRIQKAYDRFDEDEKLGMLRAEVSVDIDNDYTPTPDLSFWNASRRPELNVPIAPYPDLAIEIQSEGQNAQELYKKARRYLTAGVRLVWIIQPDKRIAAVFHQGQKSFITIQPTGELDGEEVIPGFKLKLNDCLFK